jgi:hypothetical protein
MGAANFGACKYFRSKAVLARVWSDDYRLWQSKYTWLRPDADPLNIIISCLQPCSVPFWLGPWGRTSIHRKNPPGEENLLYSHSGQGIAPVAVHLYGCVAPLTTASTFSVVSSLLKEEKKEKKLRKKRKRKEKKGKERESMGGKDGKRGKWQMVPIPRPEKERIPRYSPCRCRALF